MKNLTQGNIYKNFLLFAIPMMLAGLFSQAYHTIDTMIAGRFVGDVGVGAIGATADFISLLSSLFWGFGTGFSIWVARLFGAGEYHRMKSGVMNLLFWMSLAALLLGGLSILCYRPIFALLRVDRTLYAETLHYFIIYMTGLFSILMNSFFVFILNALGSGTYPFCMSVVSAVLNVTGNLFFVLVLNWGVAGLATASVFASAIVNLLYFRKLSQCFYQLGVAHASVRLSLRSMAPSLRYSLPVCLQQGAMYLAGFAVAPAINGLGGAATAGYAVANRIYGLNASVYQNASKAMTNYIAQSVGAKKYANVRRGLGVGLLQGLLFTVPPVLLCSLLARPLCSMFFPAGFSGAALQYAIRFAACFLPLILINMINNLFHAFFRGTATMSLLLAGTSIGSITRIVFTWILAPRFGMDGVYAGWVISWGVEILFCIFIYLIRYRNPRLIRNALEHGI